MKQQSKPINYSYGKITIEQSQHPTQEYEMKSFVYNYLVFLEYRNRYVKILR